MKKEWNAAFEEQMSKMKEKFESMSGMSETEETVLNEVSEDTTEPIGSVQGE
jgi:hypothetical protein